MVAGGWSQHLQNVVQIGHSMLLLLPPLPLLLQQLRPLPPLLLQPPQNDPAMQLSFYHQSQLKMMWRFQAASEHPC